jgi:hypothetical protein
MIDVPLTAAEQAWVTDVQALSLTRYRAYHQLLQAVAELETISHISGTSYEGRVIAHATDDDVGGKRPPGSARDTPRRPHYPPEPVEGIDPEGWARWASKVAGLRNDYEDERAGWRSSYQRRIPGYFHRALDRLLTDAPTPAVTGARLRVLRDEAVDSLAAWQRQPPLPAGGEPSSRADANWKRWVGECGWDTGDIARRFDVSRRYVQQVRKDYSSRAG